MTSASSSAGIGQRLMAARLQRGRGQAEVARAVGLAPSYLSRIENGRIQPGFRTVLEVATALGASLHELVDGPPPRDGRAGPCPVTTRGRCLLDLIADEATCASERDEEHYSPREIRLIKRFAAWLKQSGPDRLRAMEVLLEDLTRTEGKGRGR